MKDILAPNESPEAVRETELDKLNEWLRLDVRRQQLIQEYRDEATGSNASEKRLSGFPKNTGKSKQDCKSFLFTDRAKSGARFTIGPRS